MSEDFNLKRDLLITQLKEKMSENEQKMLDELMKMQPVKVVEMTVDEPEVVPEMTDKEFEEYASEEKKMRTLLLKIVFTDFMRMILSQEIIVGPNIARHVNTMMNNWEMLCDGGELVDYYKKKKNVELIKNEYRKIKKTVRKLMKKTSERNAEMRDMMNNNPIAAILNQLFGGH